MMQHYPTQRLNEISPSPTLCFLRGVEVNVKLGLEQGRLRFEVANDVISEKRFEAACQKINDLKETEWKEFLIAINTLFNSYGFYQIRK